MTRKLAFAFAAILSTSSAALAYDWTAPDGDQPNLPTVGEQSSMNTPAAGFTFNIKRPAGSTYDMADQNGSIDGKPDFESD